jgi:hypothetical protein
LEDNGEVGFRIGDHALAADGIQAKNATGAR